MKRLLLTLSLLSLCLSAQTPQPAPSPTPLPSQVFGALVWYNQAGHPRVNGSFFAAIPFPGGPSGTYIYNAFDVISMGRGQVVGVPQTGFAQHLLWMTDRVELFGLMGAGVSFAPSTPAPGTNVTSAFSGGGGINWKIWPDKGFYVPFVVKVIQAQGMNTLVGGVGISFGR